MTARIHAYEAIEVPRRRLPGTRILVIAAALIALHVVAWRVTGISPSALVQGWHGMADFLSDAVPPDLSWSGVVRPALEAAAVTLYIGLLGTTLSIPSAFLLALLASRATTRNSWVYQASRSVLSTLRAVPDVVFALIFVTAVGLGPFAGVLALVLHNTGVMGKLWAEAMEETDLGSRDALRVAGASNVQVATNAVLPTVLPQAVGLLLYRLDVNVRSSLVLGLVGAGGIGFLINQSIQLFQFDRMVTQIIIVLVLVIVVDQTSAYVRRRIAG
ncbi:phosphonate ABC transporter, permease protein PhnE [Luteipulveratus mongoliensis]|uniref:Phosphonate ABC transporter permease n=1 Tax=Luteipulveratus mongoliensis TaxID=571913 RepID=A0A0K1JEG7_9MICO|nr:phosphonate ABC transporter, permease protein PhnE [Luteipulveratus mongoliensis]AKU15094.1 phosphonate ABC transporter permease [Luteipulveratus mongoliensis]